MEPKNYFVIWRDQDEPGIKFMSKSELRRFLSENYAFLKDAPEIEEFPSKSVFILKGSVVIPQARRHVTEWEID